MSRSNRIWFGRAIVLGLIACTAIQPAAADEASRLKEARDVVSTTHSADTFRALLPTICQQLRPLLTRQGADAKTVDTLLGKMQAKMDNETDQIIDLVAHVYAVEFSYDDLTALLAFYKTPAGQHLIEKRTVIAQGMLAVGQQLGQLVGKQVLDEFAKEHAAPQPKL